MSNNGNVLPLSFDGAAGIPIFGSFDKNVFSWSRLTDERCNSLAVVREKADDDHEKQFVTQADTDVVFICSDKQIITAHSYMLKARSSTLRNKLTTDWNSGDALITDFRQEVFYEVLRFMYASKVNRLADLAEDLLKAAKVYDLKTLKLICETELVRTLDTNNSIRRFLFALECECDTLEIKSMDMINRYAAYLISTDDWVKLTPAHIEKLYYAKVEATAKPSTKRIRNDEVPAQ